MSSELLKRKEPGFSWDLTGAYFCKTLWGYSEIARKAKSMETEYPGRFAVKTMSGEGFSGPEAAGGVRIIIDGKTLEVFRPE